MTLRFTSRLFPDYPSHHHHSIRPYITYTSEKAPLSSRRINLLSGSSVLGTTLIVDQSVVLKPQNNTGTPIYPNRDSNPHVLQSANMIS